MQTTKLPPVEYRVHPKENVYFAIKVCCAIIMYYLIGRFFYSVFTTDNIYLSRVAYIYAAYAILILLFFFFMRMFLVGQLKGNAIKVSPKQFPDIYNIAAKQAVQLEFTTMPDIYIKQSGGVLNAFATRFFGVNYVVLYSDILAEAYQQNTPAVVEFIIGHEMGHVKRKHITKHLVFFPGSFVPFLGAAYSRGCEYTCDRIGHALSPEGSRQGMILLAAGRGIFTKVNVPAFLDQIETEDSFSSWLYEKCSSHPNITKRVKAFDNTGLETAKPAPVAAAPVAENTEEKKEAGDHTRFMPE